MEKQSLSKLKHKISRHIEFYATIKNWAVGK